MKHKLEIIVAVTMAAGITLGCVPDHHYARPYYHTPSRPSHYRYDHYRPRPSHGHPEFRGHPGPYDGHIRLRYHGRYTPGQRRTIPSHGRRR